MSDWQPIETAPKDGTRILVAWPRGGMAVVLWDTEWEDWYLGARTIVRNPTHWMPLPEPPRADDTEGE